MIKRLFLLLLVVVLGLVAVVFANTLRTESRQLQVTAVQKAAVDTPAAAQRLAGAIPFKTIASADDPEAGNAEFFKLHAYLEKTFPKTHAALQREVIGGKSLLYTWKGTDPRARPIALMAHQDVVPIAPGTEKEWKVDPFAGEVKDGFIWGRGTWDNKGNLFAQMEAVEMLLTAGFAPSRTIYLVMGHDEEVSGLRGAKAMADTLKQRGVQLEWLLDEGLLITDGILPVDKPAALIGVAEKGYATYQLSVDAAAGHSSMPPARTSIGIMSRALARLEDKQRPAELAGVGREMFETLAPEVTGPSRFLLSNMWLFKPLLEWQLQKAASTNAMLRSTTALTIVNAGNKENVIPGHSEASVNYRILPGETTDIIERHVKSAVGDDAVVVKPRPGNVDPSPVSSTDSAGYRTINRTIREIFPPAIVLPGLMLGGTDSRHFVGVSDAIFRFSPVRAKSEDLQMLHGTNERMSLANYAEMIQFYNQLLRNTSAK
ncbi:MAG: M20 family peptidase [Pseudomonadota bacterium]